MSSTLSQQDAQKEKPFSKRAVKSAPMVKDRDAVRETRRDMFFRKVASNREEKKWENRSDQILKLDYIKEQKRWEAEKARAAPSFEQWLEREDADAENDLILSSQLSQPLPWQSQLPRQTQSPLPSSQTLPDFAEEAEALLEYERLEVEELAAMMEQENNAPSSQHYGSDDEDYDSLFMDYLSGQENQAPQLHRQSNVADDAPFFHGGDAMDTS